MIRARVALVLAAAVLGGCASAGVAAIPRIEGPVSCEMSVPERDLPPAREAERDTLKDPDDVRERIAEIPTRLVIAAECDRQLLATAATKLVAQYRSQILEFIERPY